MGFRTQRQYTTSIDDYEAVKEAVLRNQKRVTKCDLSPPDEKGNFTFYLKKYPDVRVQITSRRYFLKLHGVKPEAFLLDLKVIRELTSLLKECYPNGIDFKLDKESYGYRDKDQVIERLEGAFQLSQQLRNKALDGPDIYQNYLENLSKPYETDDVAHDHRAEVLNNCFADILCKNGFRCKSNGMMKFHAIKGRRNTYPVLQWYIQILLKSGFLED